MVVPELQILGTAWQRDLKEASVCFGEDRAAF